MVLSPSKDFFGMITIFSKQGPFQIEYAEQSYLQEYQIAVLPTYSCYEKITFKKDKDLKLKSINS